MTKTSSTKKSSFWWYIASAVVALILLAVTSYEVALPPASSLPSPSPQPSSSTSPSSSPTISPSSLPTSSPPSNSTAITLYAGSVTSGSGTYGFGLSANDITSPGPPLSLKEGVSYTVTVQVVGSMVHSWEIVPSKAISTSPLWDAGIDISSYIPANSQGSVTFTPTQTGSFYYVCTVPAHISLGMWGTVTVS